MGRATIEAVPLMSVQQVAGPKRQGKKSDREVVDHGNLHRPQTRTSRDSVTYKGLRRGSRTPNTQRLALIV